MTEGDVVKAFVEQADGEVKMRPVVLLKKLPYFDDWLICGISSKTHTVHKNFDIPILKTHPDFQSTNLEFEMLIRAGWLINLSEKKMEGSIGKISAETLRQLKENIAKFIRQ